MSAMCRSLVALCGLALVWCLVGFCGRDIERMPQVVRGDGALAVAFGDARETISRALVHKADSYFHGGIDMDCHHLGGHHHDDNCKGGCHEADHDHEVDNDHEADHDHEEGHEHAHESDHDESERDFFDPWRWINSHIRAPEIHRHLEGKQTVELMPWFWASVRADPHNIEAWTTTWYVANNSMKDKKLALSVIDEGLRRNPDDPDLLLCRGRTFYDRGRGDVAAAHAAFLAAFESADRILKRDGDKAKERIMWARKFSKAYLDEIVKKGILP